MFFIDLSIGIGPKVVLFLLQNSQIPIYYCFEKIKKDKYLKNKKEIEQAMEWKELLFEMNPYTITAILQNNKNKNKKNSNSNNKKNRLGNSSFKRNSTIFDVFNFFGELKFINSVGKEKYNIISNKDFKNFMKKIEIESEIQTKYINEQEAIASKKKMRKIYVYKGFYKGKK